MIFLCITDHGGSVSVEKYRDSEHLLDHMRFHLYSGMARLGSVHENIQLVKDLGIYAFFKMFASEHHAKTALDEGSLPMAVAHALNATLVEHERVQKRDAARRAQANAGPAMGA